MADFQYTRVLSHGRIESLARGYKTEYPFSIYIRPKVRNLPNSLFMYGYQMLWKVLLLFPLLSMLLLW